MPLGMEDQRILSGHLRASSSYNFKHGPDRGRLNIYAGHGRIGAWVARYRNTKQWLQVDLRQMIIIKGIATQGRREANQWVRSYHLSYSRFGSRFRAYVAYGRVKVGLDLVLRTEAFFSHSVFPRITVHALVSANFLGQNVKNRPPPLPHHVFIVRIQRKPVCIASIDSPVSKPYSATKVRLATNRKPNKCPPASIKRRTSHKHLSF